MIIQDILRRSTGRKRSRGCSAKFVSYNPSRDHWRFRVACRHKNSKGSGHEVNIWLEQDEYKPPGKLEFRAACRCGAWMFWGSEFHAKTRNYLEGRPRGKATPPKIRDPKGKNLVCKHVYTVLWEMMKGRKFF